MTLVTFVVMGVALALLFVAALVAVFLLNRKDRSGSLGLATTGPPGADDGRQPGSHPGQTQQYGQQPQQYGQRPPQGQ